MENAYSRARREAERRTDFIDLIDTNFHNCGFQYPTELVRAWANRYYSAAPPRRYSPHPTGDPELLSRIAGYYNEAVTHGPVTPETVVVTASASESYSHIFASRCHPGDHVLLPKPGYPMFEDIAERFGLIVDFYHQDMAQSWSIDPEEVSALIGEHTAALVLISPNNPTGAVIAPETLAGLGDICAAAGLFVVIDQVFGEFRWNVNSSSVPTRTSSVPPENGLPATALPNVQTFTLGGASKLFASADLKVSWILVAGPDTPAAIEDLAVCNDLYLSVSSFSQFVVTRMFERGLSFTRQMTGRVETAKNAMVEEVEATEGLLCVPPGGGIHLPVIVDEEVEVDDEALCIGLMEEAGVATHPGYLYGFDQSTVLVLSYLCGPERIREGFDRIRSYIASRRRVK